MDEAVKVACAQVEPVVFDRAATLDKVATVAAEAAGQGARLVLLPETFVPVYPSSRWVRELVGGANGKPLFARLARESVEIPGPDSDRLGAIAREHRVHLALGVNERDGGTLYNSLLVYTPDGELALHHRKLVPTNHERLVWGFGDGKGLAAIQTDLGRVGGTPRSGSSRSATSRASRVRSCFRAASFSAHLATPQTSRSEKAMN